MPPRRSPFRVTWLVDTETWHEALGRFPPGSGKPVLLSVAERRALEARHWRVDPLPSGTLASPISVNPEITPLLAPEGYVMLTLTVTASFGDAPIDRTPVELMLTVHPDGGSTKARAEIGNLMGRCRKAVEQAIGNIVQFYREDYARWAREQGVTLSFEEYHAIPRGGRPRKLTDARAQALLSRRELSQRSVARTLKVSRKTVARARARR